MNRAVIASIILVICISTAILSLAYLEKTCNTMIDTADEAIHHLLHEEKDQLLYTLKKSFDQLERNRPIMNIITGQDEIIELRGSLNQATFYCNCNDYKTALLHLQEYKAKLNRIISSNEPTPSTIF